eukprot:GILJ01021587.1.p2 GENE.GILJ01021587.1~~GILJ01021587.1.p2  ORF type:complete len:175 (+),score=16.94 GILJ01021587.1:300-824(+)
MDDNAEYDWGDESSEDAPRGGYGDNGDNGDMGKVLSTLHFDSGNEHDDENDPDQCGLTLDGVLMPDGMQTPRVVEWLHQFPKHPVFQCFDLEDKLDRGEIDEEEFEDCRDRLVDLSTLVPNEEGEVNQSVSSPPQEATGHHIHPHVLPHRAQHIRLDPALRQIRRFLPPAFVPA